MLPHSLKDRGSFHNLARELSSSMPNHKLSKKPTRRLKKSRNKKSAKFYAESPYKSSEPHSSGLERSKEKPKENQNSEAVTAVPDPIPDTGQYHNTLQPSQTAAVSLPVSRLETVAVTPSATSLTPLPPLPMMPTSSASFSPTSSSSVSNAAAVHSGRNGAPSHLSTVVIALIAVGSAFLLIGLFVIIRTCSRPQKRAHPTPSLPILQDMTIDHYANNASPLFGGKERFSSAKDDDSNIHFNGGPWKWTQYPNPTASKALTTAPSARSGLNTGGTLQYSSNVAEGHTIDNGSNEKSTTQAPGNSPVQPTPFLQVQNAVTRVASRLSAASMSFYPGSPQNGDVGVALEDGNGTSFTADGLPVMNKRASKASISRKHRISTHEGQDRPRDTTYTRYSEGFAYDGADVASPVLVETARHVKIPAISPASNIATSGGRARIKSTYFAPGQYPRVSTVVPSPPKAANRISQSKGTIQRSVSSRDRDTRALASALGLASPEIPPSPQPTLYPDDSLSVAGDFKRKPSGRNQKKPTVKNPIKEEPDSEASEALGNLLLADYTYKSIATLGGDEPSSSSSFKRADDKPPRVPSPPPLPSLTQMGLEHTNPEAYAEYRSPTYSLYGLYELDRKSRTTSFGY